MKQQENTTAPAGAQVVHDDTGETDWDFFARRPDAESRTRCPFPGEFPRSVIKQARGRKIFVHVYMLRDKAGAPLHRARGIFYAEGGSA